MLTDLQCAQASFDIYSRSGEWAGIWDIDEVTLGLRVINDEQLWCFRGSDSPEDFLHDFEAVAVPHSLLGHVSFGFLSGGMQVYQNIVPRLNDKPPTFSGHSLGAPRAAVATGLMGAYKRPVAALVGFACPNPGFADFRAVVAASAARMAFYRNCGDLVPYVPEYIPGIAPWLPIMSDSILLDELPDVGRLNPIAHHSMALYLQGVKKRMPT